MQIRVGWPVLFSLNQTFNHSVSERHVDLLCSLFQSTHAVARCNTQSYSVPRGTFADPQLRTIQHANKGLYQDREVKTNQEGGRYRSHRRVGELQGMCSHHAQQSWAFKHFWGVIKPEQSRFLESWLEALGSNRRAMRRKP